MFRRKLCALIIGSVLGATLVGVPAAAEPGGGRPSVTEPAYMTKPMNELTPPELKLRIDADMEKKKQGVDVGGDDRGAVMSCWRTTRSRCSQAPQPPRVHDLDTAALVWV
jgi:hypothetical protein